MFMKTVIEGKSCVSGNFDTLFCYHGWPSVCTDENGVLYAVCSGNRVAHVCPFGKVLLYKSRGGGKTWGVPSIIFDSPLDDRDAGITYIGNGKMLITTFRHPAEVYLNDFGSWIANDAGQAGYETVKIQAELPEERRLGGSFYRIYDTVNETVSEEKRIPISTPHGPIVLRDGRIFYFGKEMYSYGEEKPEIISAYISTDGGESFVKQGECLCPQNMRWDQFHEPHCAELSDGRIMGVIRTHPETNDHTFTVYVTYSSDYGRTWSTPAETGICGSPPHLAPLSDGSFALTYARRIPSYGIYGRLVTNDGHIEDNEFKLDAAFDSDIGYPATAQLPDGSLVTVYYRRTEENGKCRIMCTRWHIEKC